MSYSHKDDRWRDALKSNLEILEREGVVEVWHDQRIMPGDKWDDAIKERLAEAEIVVFLVSADLLASEYVWEVELAMALEQQRNGQSAVLPVIVRTCSWKRTALRELQALPDGGRPLNRPRGRDEACLEVEEGIRAAAEIVRRGRGRGRL